MTYSAAHSIDELLVNKILTYRPSHPIKALIIEFYSEKRKRKRDLLNKYLKQFFPDNDFSLITKFTKFVTSTIYGENIEQRTIFWSGLDNALSGINGPSTILKLLRSIRNEDLYGALTSTDEPVVHYDSDSDSDGPPPLVNIQGEIIFE